jgi:phosphodiesterase/alkaline phosphatase D-like protein
MKTKVINLLKINKINRTISLIICLLFWGINHSYANYPSWGPWKTIVQDGFTVEFRTSSQVVDGGKVRFEGKVSRPNSLYLYFYNVRVKENDNPLYPVRYDYSVSTGGYINGTFFNFSGFTTEACSEPYNTMQLYLQFHYSLTGIGWQDADTPETTPACYSDDDGEPDDSFTQTQNLGSNTIYLTPCILADAGDYYKITPVSPYLKIMITMDQFFNEAGDFDLFLYNAPNEGSLVESSATTDNEEYIEYIAPSAGTYYIKANRYDSGKGFYDFHVSYSTVPTTPPAPSWLDATAISTSQITVTWENVSNETGYKIYRSQTPSGTYNQIGTTPANTCTYTDQGLSSGTQYCYKVKAYNASGDSGFSPYDCATPPYSGTLSPPSWVNANPTSNTTMDITWENVSNETGYKVFRSPTSNGTYSQIGTTSANVCSYPDQGLSQNTQYCYKIKAYNGNGDSDFSPSDCATTQGGGGSGPDLIVENQNVYPTTVNSGGEVTGEAYVTNIGDEIAEASNLGYYLSNDCDYSVDDYYFGLDNVGSLDPGETGNLEYKDLTIPDNTTSGTWYIVFFADKSHQVEESNENNNDECFPITVIGPEPPPPPVALEATNVTQTSFKANWEASTGATKYYLDVATDNSFTNFVSGYNNKDVGNVLNYNVTGLTAGTSYWYRIRAYKTPGGQSANSNVINVITVPPNPVAIDETNVQATSFQANWNASTGSTGYELDVATNSTFTNFVSGYEDLNVGYVLNKSVTGLTPGTDYWYRIRAFNGSGTSSNSNAIQVTTSVIPIPPPPVAISATIITQTSFKANWETSNGATGYKLDVATDNSFTNFVSGYDNKDVGNVITYNVTGLSSGTNYYYRLRAYNDGGTSGNSNVINPITVPTNPVATDASNITQTSFQANWNSVTGASGYKLDVAYNNIFTNFVTGYNNKDVGNETYYLVTGLTAGTTYYYRVRAYNEGGISGNSNVTIVILIPPNPILTSPSIITTTSFHVNWNSSLGAAGYNLDIALNYSFTDFVPGYNNKDVGNVLNYNVTGLSSGTVYWIRLRAYNASGTSGNSDPISVITLPSPPVATDATNIAQTSFMANWNASTGSTGYKLDVATNISFTNFVPGFNNKDVGNVLNYDVTSLTLGSYWYRLRAYNESGTSGNSNVINTIMLTPPLPPLATNATNITQTSFKANWEASNGATGYKLDIALNNTFTNFLPGYNNKEVGNILNINIPGLTAGTNYFYRLRAYNSIGTSDNSNIISTQTLSPIVIALDASYVLETSFQANWNPATGANGYKLDVALENSFTIFIPGYENIDVDNVTSYFVTGLVSNHHYYYRLRAYNAGGTNNNSNTIEVLTSFYTGYVETESKNIISIYPNPASGSAINIELSVNLSSENHEITIYDSHGSLVSEIKNNKDLLIPINVSSFGSGVYIMKYRSANHIISKTFIVK